MPELREGWNVHDIAMSLEVEARTIMNIKNDICDTIFSACFIESENFVEAMILLLRFKSNYENNVVINNFIAKCKPYFHVSGNKIDKRIVDDLYNEFTKIINNL